MDGQRSRLCNNGLIRQWDVQVGASTDFDRQPTTLEGLKKVMTSVWDNLVQAVVQKAFRGWSKRIEMMIKGGEHHIEHKLSGGKNSDNK